MEKEKRGGKRGGGRILVREYGLLGRMGGYSFLSLLGPADQLRIKTSSRVKRLTILATVLGRPSESFSPLLVPAPEYPETPKMVGIWVRSR